jgi:hypothetical protein
VIRNLGTKFCNMSDEELSDNNLKKKKSSSGSVGQKRTSKRIRKMRRMKIPMKKINNRLKKCYLESGFCLLKYCVFGLVNSRTLCSLAGTWVCMFYFYDTLLLDVWHLVYPPSAWVWVSFWHKTFQFT